MSSNYVNEYAGKIIRDVRLSKSLTLNELASQVKVSYQQLQKYEKGTNRLSIDKLYDISRFLGLEIRNFFPGAHSQGQDDTQKVLAGDMFGTIADKEARDIVLKLMVKLADKKA